MKLKKMREILGKDAEGMSDEEMIELGDVTEMLVNIIIDQWHGMSSAERRKWIKKHNLSIKHP